MAKQHPSLCILALGMIALSLKARFKQQFLFKVGKEFTGSKSYMKYISTPHLSAEDEIRVIKSVLPNGNSTCR